MGEANLLLYMNLTGETYYIIVHRMKCQKIREDLQQRVYNDLGASICQPSVIQSVLNGTLNLFEKQFSDLKSMIDRIVHSSIMSVNEFSMEKVIWYIATLCIHLHPSTLMLYGNFVSAI